MFDESVTESESGECDMKGDLQEVLDGPLVLCYVSQGIVVFVLSSVQVYRTDVCLSKLLDLFYYLNDRLEVSNHLLKSR